LTTIGRSTHDFSHCNYQRLQRCSEAISHIATLRLYMHSGRPRVPRRRVWAHRGNYWTMTATNQHAQWAVMLCNWLIMHTVSLTVDCWLIDS